MKRNQKFICILVVMSVLLLSACTNAKLNNEEVINENEQENSPELHDELDLSIGESGLTESELGKAKISLESVELVDEEKLEQDAKYAPLFVMHLTIKNVGDQAFSPKEVLSSGILLGPDDNRGMKWMYYEISEEWVDKLNPDDETTGVIVISHPEEDEYQLVFGDKNLAQNMLTPVIKFPLYLNIVKLRR